MLLPSVLIVVMGLVFVEGSGFNKIMSFPTASTSNYISYRPGMPTLTAYTVCAWQMDKSSDTGTRFWFSYSVSGNDNLILLGDSSAGITLYMGSPTTFDIGALPKNQWYHLCVSWDSASGATVLSIDGKAKLTITFAGGTSVRAGGILVIAQDQDSPGGGFNSAQSFVGKIYDVNLWNYALTADEVAALYEHKPDVCGSGSGTTKNAPIISYTDLLAQTMHGAASVIEDTCSDDSGDDFRCYDSHGEEYRGGDSFTAVSETKYLH